MATIREADGRVDIDEIRTLFEEYAQSLGVDLSFRISASNWRDCRVHTRHRAGGCSSPSTARGRSDASAFARWATASAR